MNQEPKEHSFSREYEPLITELGNVVIKHLPEMDPQKNAAAVELRQCAINAERAGDHEAALQFIAAYRELLQDAIKHVQGEAYQCAGIVINLAVGLAWYEADLLAKFAVEVEDAYTYAYNTPWFPAEDLDCLAAASDIFYHPKKD